MSGEFGLAGGGEEHVEDWLECFRTVSPSPASVTVMGFATSSDKGRIEAHVRHAVQLNVYQDTDPTASNLLRMPVTGPPVYMSSTTHRMSNQDRIGSVSIKTLTSLAENADDTIFDNILADPQHVLHHLLPSRTRHSYKLRPRSHDCSLTVKSNARNFITKHCLKTCISLN